MAILTAYTAPLYTPPKTIWLYHITPWQNLAGILKHGGLMCGRLLAEQGITTISVAHEHIQQRRGNKQVSAGPGGFLPDYVPWSFARRQPMLCSIAHMQVENQAVKQQEMVHLVTKFDLVEEQGLKWAFSDRHPVVKCQFFDDVKHFDHIDWPLMGQMFWNNTEEEGDRTVRRQSEFLIHTFAPWSLVHGIATMNKDTADHVKNIISQSDHQPIVKVQPTWYF